MPGPRRRTDPAEGSAAAQRAVTALRAGLEPTTGDVRTAVRYLLDELAAQAPGRAVEVRVPPYGVVQCVAGLRHTRGTPPNVVEMPPADWLLLAVGDRGWAEAVDAGRVRASGSRSSLEEFLPLMRV